MLKPEPVILTARVVRLEPLGLQHAEDLAAAGRDPQIWKYMRYGVVDTPDKMRHFIQHLMELQTAGTDLPFTVIQRETGRAIGMTRYLNIEPTNRAVEIGGTWYAPEFQRTAVNTECKYLLLEHAFECLGCIRVQFKADLRNERSQHAIERIGGVREWVLRNHMILQDGTVRSSVFFSILAEEWPAVKERLHEKMGQSYPKP